jgi:hypothetical protein
VRTDAIDSYRHLGYNNAYDPAAMTRRGLMKSKARRTATKRRLKAAHAPSAKGARRRAIRKKQCRKTWRPDA